jgi:protein tyrosine phosphatase
VDYKHVPVPDYSAPSLPAIIEAVKWIHGRNSSGGAVLVHCNAGRGRSVIMALGYLLVAKEVNAPVLFAPRGQLNAREDRAIATVVRQNTLIMAVSFARARGISMIFSCTTSRKSTLRALKTACR